MTTTLETSYKKATQALNFLAQKKDGKINKMKAIKLIFLADRLHLRKYGRPIIGDTYWAIKMGPVGSRVKRVAELATMPEDAFSYAKKYIQPTDEKKHYVASIRAADIDVFSKTDLECLEAVYEQFGDKDQFELKDITHQYPEWIKHEKNLASGKKRAAMNYDDFFISTQKKDPLFAEDKADLVLARETFNEMKMVTEFFAR